MSVPIPDRFREAFRFTCPDGVWRLLLVNIDTGEASEYTYDVARTWELINTLAERDPPRAVEILGYFGFALARMPEPPRARSPQEWN